MSETPVPGSEVHNTYMRGVTPEPILNAWMLLRGLHEVCNFQTQEGKKVGRATSSELRRWINNKVLHINGEPVEPHELLDFPVFSVVLFPNNQFKRCSLL